MYFQSNGGKMLITHKSQVVGYKPHLWFDQNDITKLITLNNIINQYRVTYDRLYEMLIVHQQEHGTHNTNFRMHKSGLHYYDPEDEKFVFVNKVAGNKENYSKW